jgi:hypothetical protein
MAALRRISLVVGAGMVALSGPMPATAGPDPSGFLISGVVLRSDHTPANGASVFVTQLNAVTVPGGPLLKPLAHAVARLDGSFAFTPAISPGLTGEALSNAGRANLLAVAVLPGPNGTAVGQWALPVIVDPATNALSLLHPGPVNITLGSPHGPASNTIPAGAFCTFGAGQVGAPQYAQTTVAEMHNWTDMTVDFTDKYSSSTEIDVGASSSGSGWSLSGTSSVSNINDNSNGLTRTGRYGREMRPNFRYVKLSHFLDCPIRVQLDYTVQADHAWPGLAEGADVSSKDGPSEFVAHNHPGQLSSWPAGGKFTKNQGKTQRYDAAATAFGFSFGTVSEYTTNLQYAWTFGSKYPIGTSYHLWGDTGGVEPAQNVLAWAGEPSDLIGTSCAGAIDGGIQGGQVVWTAAVSCPFPFQTGDELQITIWDAPCTNSACAMYYFHDHETWSGSPGVTEWSDNEGWGQGAVPAGHCYGFQLDYVPAPGTPSPVPANPFGGGWWSPSHPSTVCS